MKELKLKTIIAVSLMLISCVIMLLMSGMSAFATSEETTEETTINAELEEGYWNTPPDWWDEELFLESAVKIIQESDNSYNQAWDGEYEYFALGIGVTPSYPDYVDFYVTFYKDEPEFFIKDGDTYGIQTNRAYYLQGTYNPTLYTERYGFQSVSGTLYHANDKDPYELIESYPDGYRIYYYEYEDFTNHIRSTTDITFFSNSVNMYEERRYYQTTNIPSDCFENIGLNPPEAAEEAVNLSVNFTPTLSGEVDRIVEQNGVSAESDYFSMSITNNSSKNAQFVFAILPEGGSLNVSSAEINRNTGFDISASNGVFYYSCKEWVYAPTMAYKNTMQAFTMTKYYQSSAWHLVGGGSTYKRSFNWNQINLQAGASYDAVVFAVPNDFDCASRNFSNPIGKYFIDLSEGAEVYRSTFSVPNPVAYDPNNTEFGNESNSGIRDVTAQGEEAEGYVDNETGETVIEDVNYSEKVDEWKEWNDTVRIIQNEDGTFDLSGFSLDSVQSMLNTCLGVFGFFQAVLSFLPMWFWSIFLVGVICVVAVGVIKSLK